MNTGLARRIERGVVVAVTCAAVVGGGSARGAVGKERARMSIPFPEALSDAEIRVNGLSSLLDDALLIGNGDINGLIRTEHNGVSMILTKNDVWDARLITANDPPLPTLDRIKELGRAGRDIKDPVLPEGVKWSGKDCYHSNAYPCPRACARLRFGGQTGRPFWRQARAQGSHNGWERRGDATVMSIEGGKGASNGYAYGPLKLSTEEFGKLRVKLSGSENARFFVEVTDPIGECILAGGWKESPSKSREHAFDLPADKRIGTITLYTWTEDGKRAENRFESVRFEGRNASHVVDLAVTVPATSPGRIDLRRAVATVGGCKGGPPRADIRALTERNVFLIDTPAAADLVAVDGQDLPPATRGEDGGVVWIRQIIPGDLDWPGMSFAVAMASSGSRKVVAIVSSRESSDVVADAVKLARSTLKAANKELIGRHERAWDRFWSKSGVTMDDPLLQRTWYRSLYFLRCVSKPGSISPGLFASLTTDTPAWHGDYHTNYNIQQTFWGCYSANHPELAEPYDRLIAEYLPRARWLARQVFSMGGAYYPHVLYAYEPSDPSACKSVNGRQYIHHVWGMTIGVNGFSVQPLWWHYKYAPNRKLLEEIVYPAIRDVAVFYAEFVEKCEGGETVRLGPSVSPEHWAWAKRLERNYDCAFDIAMVRYTLSAAIEAARTLGRDEELVGRFEKAMKRLPGYPLYGKDEPIVVDVDGAPPITYNISVPATPVFPGDVVTWWSPRAEKSLFARTIEGLKWNGNNATVMLAVSRARLSMPGTQAWLAEEVRERTRGNGTMTLNRLKPHHGFNDFGHYTEQFGTGMAVSELLVQSVADVIRVFPAIDNNCNASFADLRTQGGFLVSATRTADAIGAIKIESTAGGRLKMQSPWPEIEVRRKGGARYQRVKPGKNGIVSLDTREGDALEFRRRAKGE